MRKSIITLLSILSISGCSYEQINDNLSKSSFKQESKSTPVISMNQSITSTFETDDKEALETHTEISIQEDKLKIVPKIIMNAHLRAEVKDYSKIYKSIKLLVKKSDGYIANENESKSKYQISNNIEIKIPVSYFNTTINDLDTVITSFTEKRITAQDVTSSYYDLETRIKTKKKVEMRYLDILKNAKTIKEILKVENELGSIREAIESAEGKLKTLSYQVSYSTINLSIFQDYNYVPTMAEGFGFWKKIGNGLSTGWSGILSLIIGIAYLWPLLVVGMIIGYYVRKRLLRKAKSSLKEA